MALRRFTLIPFLALFVVPGAAAAIRAYPLDERSVYTIRISRDVPTTCVFPGALGALEGAGIASKAEDEPPVLLSFQAGAPHFSVRALKVNATAALNVVFRGKIYVLCFVGDGEADRAVTFLDEPLAGAMRRVVRSDELRTLAERVKNDGRIRAQFPGMIAVIPRRALAATTHYPAFTATIEEVLRFEAEDALVFRMRFENRTERPVSYDPNAIGIRAGREFFRAGFTDASGGIPAHSSTIAYVAVTGTPDGGRANLSVEENFSVLVTAAP